MRGPGAGRNILEPSLPVPRARRVHGTGSILLGPGLSQLRGKGPWLTPLCQLSARESLL